MLIIILLSTDYIWGGVGEIREVFEDSRKQCSSEVENKKTKEIVSKVAPMLNL